MPNIGVLISVIIAHQVCVALQDVGVFIFQFFVMSLIKQKFGIDYIKK